MLADGDGEEHGVGLLRRADAARGTATVLTPVCPDPIRRVRVGMVLRGGADVPAAWS